MVTAAILFAIAALGGITMAGMRFTGKPVPPIWLAAIHGVIAAAGLITLIVTVAGGTVPKIAIAALVGFIIAALGGFFLLLGFHLRKKELPIGIVLTHGILALASFLLLLLAIFGV